MTRYNFAQRGMTRYKKIWWLVCIGIQFPISALADKDPPWRKLKEGPLDGAIKTKGVTEKLQDQQQGEFALADARFAERILREQGKIEEVEEVELMEKTEQKLEGVLGKLKEAGRDEKVEMKVMVEEVDQGMADVGESVGQNRKLQAPGCSANCNACSGPTTCTNCSSGYFLDAGACQACIANCDVCVVGTNCTTCSGGYYVSGNACQAWGCTTGGANACKSCIDQADRTGGAQCKTCNAGYYLSGISCQANVCNCPNGVAEIAPACTTNLETECSSCNPGYYKSVTLTCEAYSCTTGSGSSCKTCVSQTSRTVDDECATCNSGYRVVGKVCEAWACTTGSGSSCKACVSQASRTVDNHCAECNIGYHVVGTSCQACETDCNVCSDSTTCTTCGNSKYLHSTDCVDSCPAAHFGIGTGASGRSCQACKLNCLNCTNSTDCSLCGNDKYLHFDSCLDLANSQCPSGYYKSGNGTSGRTCEAYGCTTGSGSACKTCVTQTSRFSDTTCATCNDRYSIFAAPSNTCQACESNCSVCTSATVCDVCTDSFYLHDQSCIAQCPMGYSAVQNSSSQTNFKSCQVCTIGKYQNDSTLTECEVCSPGRYGDESGLSACKVCSVGKYSLNGSSDCEACDTGRFQDTNESATCKVCSPGRYGDVSGLSICKVCSVGSYSLNGSSDCEACTPGKFQDTNESATCKVCTSGRYGDVSGLSLCKVCSAGTYSTSEASLCEACLGGKFQDNDESASCKDCPAGDYADEEGSTACKVCAAGNYSTSNSLSCKVCLGGSARRRRSEQCDPCLNGTYNDAIGALADTCTDCSRGWYADDMGMSLCKACERGKYRNVTGAIFCKLCLAGEYSDDFNSTSCKACESGKYQEIEASSSCKACDRGKYQEGAQNVAENAACKDCEKGKYQGDPAQTACKACEEGRYVSRAGDVDCTSCEVGRYNRLRLQIICPFCLPGHWNDLPGQTACKKCEAGRWNPAWQAVSSEQCIPCTRGRYSPVEAATYDTCEVCPDGNFSGDGSSNCNAAQPGNISTVILKDDPENEDKYNYNCMTGSGAACETCEVPMNRLAENHCIACNDGYFLAGLFCQALRIAIKHADDSLEPSNEAVSYSIVGNAKHCGQEQYRSVSDTPDECRQWCTSNPACLAYVTYESSSCDKCMAYTANDCSPQHQLLSSCSGVVTAYNKQGIVTTSSVEDVSAGASTLSLADVSGLSAGMWLTISSSGNSETKTILSINPDSSRRLSSRRLLVSGNVTLDGMLVYSYTQGASVVVTPKAETTTTESPTTIASTTTTDAPTTTAMASAATTWRIRATSNSVSTWNPSELLLYTDTGCTQQISMSGASIMASHSTHLSYVPENIIDGSTSTFWDGSCVGTCNGAWIQITLPTPVEVRCWRICQRNLERAAPSIALDRSLQNQWTTVSLGTNLDDLCDAGSCTCRSIPIQAIQACTWEQHDNEYSSGYAGGVSTVYELNVAKEQCIQNTDCKAITCSGSDCTLRASSSLATSSSGEITYSPTQACYLQATGHTRWILAGAGQSCHVACSGYSCREDVWPTSQTGFEAILSSMGYSCNSISAGDWAYNPVSESGSCYWSGSASLRCGGSGSGRRFCPCETTTTQVALVNNGVDGCTSSSPCQECNGDCDSDSDCVAGLTCFQRSGYTAVPGCTSGGSGDVNDYDYCYEAFASKTGDCDMTGNCVSSRNYPGNYGNYDSCTVTMLRGAFLNAESLFEVESGYDKLVIKGTTITSASSVPISITAGERFTWNTDSSTTKSGWKICFTAATTSQASPRRRRSYSPRRRRTSTPRRRRSYSPRRRRGSISSSPRRRRSYSPRRRRSYSPRRRRSQASSNNNRVVANTCSQEGCQPLTSSECSAAASADSVLYYGTADFSGEPSGCFHCSEDCGDSYANRYIWNSNSGDGSCDADHLVGCVCDCSPPASQAEECTDPATAYWVLFISSLVLWCCCCCCCCGAGFMYCQEKDSDVGVFSCASGCCAMLFTIAAIIFLCVGILPEACTTTTPALASIEGDCAMTDNCVSSLNYPGDYGNSQSCTVTMLRDASLNVQSPFSMEYGNDVLRIRGTTIGSSSEVPSIIYEGEKMSWYTDSSVTYTGWKICLEEATPATSETSPRRRRSTSPRRRRSTSPRRRRSLATTTTTSTSTSTRTTTPTTTLTTTSTSSTEACLDIDLTTDSNYNSCASYLANYAGYSSDTYCGYNDDSDFTSSELCCVCGGGRKANQPYVTAIGSGKYGMSIAKVGGIVWNDRNYTFGALPDQLEGAMLFRGPHRIPTGDRITLDCGNKVGNMFALLDDTRRGTFPTTLVADGWSLLPDLPASWSVNGSQQGLDVYTKPVCTTSLPASSGYDVLATFVFAEQASEPTTEAAYDITLSGILSNLTFASTADMRNKLEANIMTSLDTGAAVAIVIEYFKTQITYGGFSGVAQAKTNSIIRAVMNLPGYSATGVTKSDMAVNGLNYTGTRRLQTQTAKVVTTVPLAGDPVQTTQRLLGILASSNSEFTQNLQAVDSYSFPSSFNTTITSAPMVQVKVKATVTKQSAAPPGVTIGSNAGALFGGIMSAEVVETTVEIQAANRKPDQEEAECNFLQNAFGDDSKTVYWVIFMSSCVLLCGCCIGCVCCAANEGGAAAAGAGCCGMVFAAAAVIFLVWGIIPEACVKTTTTIVQAADVYTLVADGNTCVQNGCRLLDSKGCSAAAAEASSTYYGKVSFENEPFGCYKCSDSGNCTTGYQNKYIWNSWNISGQDSCSHLAGCVCDCSQASEPELEPEPEPEAAASPFDGTWTGVLYPQSKEIVGTTLTWGDGSTTSPMEIISSTSFSVVLRGTKYTAVLQGDGKLYWDDADIWTRHFPGEDVVITSIAEFVLAGATTLKLADVSGLSADMSITIYGVTSETKTIVSIDRDRRLSSRRLLVSGSVTLDGPLQYNYTQGASVVVILQATGIAANSTTTLQARFSVGTPNCPIDYDNIAGRAECQSAAQSLGFTWVGDVCPTNRLKGCFQKVPDGHVYYTGLCAGGSELGNDKLMCMKAYTCGNPCRTCVPEANRQINNHCATCNAGYFLSGRTCEAITSAQTCADMDNGATNANGEGCGWYSSNGLTSCDSLSDDDDFTSSVMCCDCGGGQKGQANPLAYYTISGGTCPEPITSQIECTLAGQSLGLGEIQGSSIQSGPAHCYYEDYLLKYNTNEGSTGNCTDQEICLCARKASSSSCVTAIEIGAFGDHSMILLKTGGVLTVGQNTVGQLGDGSKGNKASFALVVPNEVVAISAGPYHSMILKTDGSVHATGQNDDGQFGDDNQTDRTSFVKVVENEVAAIAAGQHHSMILKTDGSVHAAGRNTDGQLGDNTYIQKTSFVQVIDEVAAIAAGAFHSIILGTNGAVRVAGRNTDGQLGDGTTTTKESFVLVQGINEVSAVAAGLSHSMILKTDGSVHAAGANGDGQLGDGTMIQRTSFVQVVANEVAAIAAGDYHSMILMANGSVHAVGQNTVGQLGDGSKLTRTSFVQVVANDVAAISAGAYHSIILKTDGSVLTVGQNTLGQLGDGTTSEKTTFGLVVVNGMELCSSQATCSVELISVQNVQYAPEANGLYKQQTNGNGEYATYKQSNGMYLYFWSLDRTWRIGNDTASGVAVVTSGFTITTTTTTLPGSNSSNNNPSDSSNSSSNNTSRRQLQQQSTGVVFICPTDVESWNEVYGGQSNQSNVSGARRLSGAPIKVAEVLGGASITDLCDTGKYSSMVASSECIRCAKGSGAAIEGQSECTTCQLHDEDFKVEMEFVSPPGLSINYLHSFASESACEQATGKLDETKALGFEGEFRDFGTDAIYLAVAADRGTTGCEKIGCNSVTHPGCTLKYYGSFPEGMVVGDEAKMVVVLGPDECDTRFSTLKTVPFGCQKGTVQQFLILPTFLLAAVVLLGLIVEFVLNSWTEIVVEGRVEIELDQQDDVSDIYEEDIKRDMEKMLGMQDGIGKYLKRNKKKFKYFRAWVTSGEGLLTRSIYVEFSVEVVQKVSGLKCKGTRDAFQLAEFKSKLENASWKVVDNKKKFNPVKKPIVKIFPAGVVKAKGSMFGLEFLATIEKMLPAQLRRNPDWDYLHKHVGRALLHSAKKRKDFTILLCCQFLANYGVALGIIYYAHKNFESCRLGYPLKAHYFWGGYSMVFMLWNMYSIYLYGGDRVGVFFKRCFWNLGMRTFLAFCCITDAYQDATFPLVARKCGFDIWYVSVALVIIGCGIMQFGVLLFMIIRCWYRIWRASTPETVTRANIESIFLLARAADNMPLCYAIRPAIEEEFGGECSWAIKMAEARVPFFRFFFEDVEQGSLQVMFLVHFQAASGRDKAAIIFSVLTSCVSTAFTVVQVLPLLREWIWQRVLGKLARSPFGRFCALVGLFALYRLIVTIPWIWVCSKNTADQDYNFLVWSFRAKSRIMEECVFAFFVACFIFTMTAVTSEVLKYVLTKGCRKRSMLEEVMKNERENNKKSEDEKTIDKMEKTLIGIQECTEFEDPLEPWLETAQDVYTHHSSLKDISIGLYRSLVEYALPQFDGKGSAATQVLNLLYSCVTSCIAVKHSLAERFNKSPVPIYDSMPSERTDVLQKLLSLRKDAIILDEDRIDPDNNNNNNRNDFEDKAGLGSLTGNNDTDDSADRINKGGDGIHEWSAIGLTYDGQWSNGKADGHGLLKIKQDQVPTPQKNEEDEVSKRRKDVTTVFEGRWKEDAAQGRGTMHWETDRGHYDYDGDWKAGCFHGKGKISLLDTPQGKNRSLAGEFAYGELKDKGIYIEEQHHVKFVPSQEEICKFPGKKSLEELGLKLNEDNNSVYRVEDGSQAAKKGIQVGWRLIEVSGDTKDRVAKLRNAMKSKEPYEVIFSKMSKEIFTLQPGEVGLEFEDSNRISKVKDGFQAEKHGIKVGWRVVAIGKQQFTPKELENAQNRLASYRVTLTKEEEVPIEFKPGPHGLKFANNISAVEGGSIGEDQGVKVGWRIVKVGKQEFTRSRLDNKMNGNSDYEVTFATEAKDSTFVQTTQFSEQKEAMIISLILVEKKGDQVSETDYQKMMKDFLENKLDAVTEDIDVMRGRIRAKVKLEQPGMTGQPEQGKCLCFRAKGKPEQPRIIEQPEQRAVRVVAKLLFSDGISCGKSWSSVLQEAFVDDKSTLTSKFESVCEGHIDIEVKSISLMLLKDERIPWELELFGLDEECCKQWLVPLDFPTPTVLDVEYAGGDRGIKVTEKVAGNGLIDTMNALSNREDDHRAKVLEGDFIVAVNGKFEKHEIHREIQDGALAVVIRRFEASSPIRGVYEILDEDWEVWDPRHTPLEKGTFVNVLETRNSNGFISGRIERRIQKNNRTDTMWIPLRRDSHMWARKVASFMPESRYRKFDAAVEKVHRAVTLRKWTQQLLRRSEFVYGGLKLKGKELDEKREFPTTWWPSCCPGRRKRQPIASSFHDGRKNDKVTFEVGDVVYIVGNSQKWRVLETLENGKVCIQEIRRNIGSSAITYCNPEALRPYEDEIREEEKQKGQNEAHTCWLIHWSDLEESGCIPPFEGIHFGDERDDKIRGRQKICHAVEQSDKQKLIPVTIFFSHPWLRPQEAKPDDDNNTKARKLVEFAKWYRDFCYCQTKKRIDVWFWIDYSCVDQNDPYPYMSLLPAILAACEIVLTWQTPDFDRRCWTCVERMLAYSFCRSGMMPYSINETFKYAEKFQERIHGIEKELRNARRLPPTRGWFLSRRVESLAPVWKPFSETLAEELETKKEEIKTQRVHKVHGVIQTNSKADYMLDIGDENNGYFGDVKAFLEGSTSTIQVVFKKDLTKWQIHQGRDKRTHMKDVLWEFKKGQQWYEFEDVDKENLLHDTFCKGEDWNRSDWQRNARLANQDTIRVCRKVPGNKEEDEGVTLCLSEKERLVWYREVDKGKGERTPLFEKGQEDDEFEFNRRFFSGYENAAIPGLECVCVVNFASITAIPEKEGKAKEKDNIMYRCACDVNTVRTKEIVQTVAVCCFIEVPANKDKQKVIRTFQPGAHGLTFSEEGNTITFVNPGMEAARRDIKVGWRLEKVGGEKYSFEILDKASSGRAPYRVEFRKAGKAKEKWWTMGATCIGIAKDDEHTGSVFRVSQTYKTGSAKLVPIDKQKRTWGGCVFDVCTLSLLRRLFVDLVIARLCVDWCSNAIMVSRNDMETKFKALPLKGDWYRAMKDFHPFPAMAGPKEGGTEQKVINKVTEKMEDVDRQLQSVLKKLKEEPEKDEAMVKKVEKVVESLPSHASSQDKEQAERQLEVARETARDAEKQLRSQGKIEAEDMVKIAEQLEGFLGRVQEDGFVIEVIENIPVEADLAQGSTNYNEKSLNRKLDQESLVQTGFLGQVQYLAGDFVVFEFHKLEGGFWTKLPRKVAVAEGQFANMQALPMPQRRPRKLVYPMDTESCSISNISDLRYVEMLTKFALEVPANEIFKDRQSVEWGLTEVVEQTLVSLEPLGNLVDEETTGGKDFVKIENWEPKWLKPADVEEHSEFLARVIEHKEVKEIASCVRKKTQSQQQDTQDKEQDKKQLDKPPLVLVNYGSGDVYYEGSTKRDKKVEEEAIKSVAVAIDMPIADEMPIKEDVRVDEVSFDIEGTSQEAEEGIKRDGVFSKKLVGPEFGLPLPLTMEKMKAERWRMKARKGEAGKRPAPGPAVPSSNAATLLTKGEEGEKSNGTGTRTAGIMKILKEAADTRYIMGNKGMLKSTSGIEWRIPAADEKRVSIVQGVEKNKEADKKGIKAGWELLRVNVDSQEGLNHEQRMASLENSAEKADKVPFLMEFREATRERVERKLEAAIEYGYAEPDLLELAEYCEVDASIIEKARSKAKDLADEVAEAEKIEKSVHDGSTWQQQGKDLAKKHARMAFESLEKAWKLPFEIPKDKALEPHKLLRCREDRRLAAEALRFSIDLSILLRIQVDPLLKQAKERWCGILLEDAIEISVQGIEFCHIQDKAFVKTQAFQMEYLPQYRVLEKLRLDNDESKATTHEAKNDAEKERMKNALDSNNIDIVEETLEWAKRKNINFVPLEARLKLLQSDEYRRDQMKEKERNHGIPVRWQSRKTFDGSSNNRLTVPRDDLKDKVQAFMNSEEQRGYRTFKLNKLVEVEDPDKFKAYFELKTQIQTRLAGQQCLWPEYLEEKKNKQGEHESWLSKKCDPARTAGINFLESHDVECIPLDDNLNEVYLWHASEKWNDVLTKGFEPSSDSTKEAFLGEGMYFSESLEQAHRFAKKHEIRDADGDYVILLCRVLLGRPKLAVRQGIKEDEELKFYWKRCDISEDVYAKKQAEEGLAVESNESKPRVLYDSLLGEANQSSRPDRAFVVFRKERIFPEYIVKYIEPTTSQGVNSASPRQSL